MEAHLWIVLRVDDAFMFMAPDDEVQELREEVLRQVASRRVCGALLFSDLSE